MSKVKSVPEETKTGTKIDWRKGNFLEAKQESYAEQQIKNQLIADSPYGSGISAVTIDQKQTSKHAKRRANKKARIER